jgi:outer membrane protein
MRRVAIVVCATALWSAAASADDTVSLTLQQAEQRAVDNHPQVRAGHYASLAAGEAVRQARSTYLPTVVASFTGAGAQDGTRIAAGGLNNPTILDRFAAGFAASQLLTDFGRTSALVQADTLRADAQEQNATMQRADVLLEVDRAYFNALRAQAVLKVARQTVEARQLVVDQVSALAASSLKSSLDVSFAKVNLGQAQLLAVQAQNDVQAAYAALTAAMGASTPAEYELADEPPTENDAGDKVALIARALNNRPDVAARRLSTQAASRFSAAERALWFPAVSAVGAAGFTPYHQLGLNDRYSALGINISVPLANGNLYSSRHAEAAFREQVEEEGLRELENRITRDVTVAWLDVKTARQKIDLTSQLLAEAADALDLAQARYNLGLSSIVELTQAQLNQTQAQIEQATARYEYQAKGAALKYQVGDLK